jgi:hypothetical protein
MTNISMVFILASLVAHANDEPIASLALWVGGLIMYIASSVLK